MEAIACIATVGGMLESVKKLLGMADQVHQNRTQYWYLTRRLLRAVELFEDLLKRRADLNDDIELSQALSESLSDIERLSTKAAEMFKERRGIKVLKTHFIQWWNIEDIRLELKRIKGELADCYQRFLLSGVVRIEIMAYHMNSDIASVMQAMRPMLAIVRGQAEALAGAPPQVEDNLLNPPKQTTSATRARDTARTRWIGGPSIDPSSSKSRRYIPKVGDSTQERKDAIAETIRITGYLTGEKSDMSPEELGDLLSRLGLTLIDLGWRDQAVGIMESDVQVHRSLCQERPLVFQPHLAKSLHNLAVALWNVDRKPQAVKAIEEAVEIYRNLSTRFPTSFEQDLARSLIVLSNQADGIGRKEDGMNFIEEAVGIFQKLAQDYPADFEPDVASTLHNYSNRLSNAGRQEDGLKAISQAVEIRRILVRDFPNEFKADLALSLVSMSGQFSRANRKEEALTVIQEAIAFHRQLVEDRPRVFEPILVTSLISLSLGYSRLRDKDKALAAIQETMQLFQKIEAGNLRGSTAIQQLEGLAKYCKALGWNDHSLCIETGLTRPRG